MTLTLQNAYLRETSPRTTIKDSRERWSATSEKSRPMKDMTHKKQNTPNMQQNQRIATVIENTTTETYRPTITVNFQTLETSTKKNQTNQPRREI